MFLFYFLLISFTFEKIIIKEFKEHKCLRGIYQFQFDLKEKSNDKDKIFYFKIKTDKGHKYLTECVCNIYDDNNKKEIITGGNCKIIKDITAKETVKAGSFEIIKEENIDVEIDKSINLDLDVCVLNEEEKEDYEADISFIRLNSYKFENNKITYNFYGVVKQRYLKNYCLS